MAGHGQGGGPEHYAAALVRLAINTNCIPALAPGHPPGNGMDTRPSGGGEWHTTGAPGTHSAEFPVCVSARCSMCMCHDREGNIAPQYQHMTPIRPTAMQALGPRPACRSDLRRKPRFTPHHSQQCDVHYDRTLGRPRATPILAGCPMTHLYRGDEPVGMVQDV